jgi:hypothetical protein
MGLRRPSLPLAGQRGEAKSDMSSGIESLGGGHAIARRYPLLRRAPAHRLRDRDRSKEAFARGLSHFLTTRWCEDAWPAVWRWVVMFNKLSLTPPAFCVAGAELGIREREQELRVRSHR